MDSCFSCNLCSCVHSRYSKCVQNITWKVPALTKLSKLMFSVWMWHAMLSLKLGPLRSCCLQLLGRSVFCFTFVRQPACKRVDITGYTFGIMSFFFSRPHFCVSSPDKTLACGMIHIPIIISTIGNSVYHICVYITNYLHFFTVFLSF